MWKYIVRKSVNQNKPKIMVVCNESGDAQLLSITRASKKNTLVKKKLKFILSLISARTFFMNVFCQINKEFINAMIRLFCVVSF